MSTVINDVEPGVRNTFSEYPGRGIAPKHFHAFFLLVVLRHSGWKMTLEPRSFLLPLGLLAGKVIW